MEEIREAVQRAKAHEALSAQPQSRERRRPQSLSPSLPPAIHTPIREIELDIPYVQEKRIVAHDHAGGRSAPYDMLRTQVLHAMDVKDWKLIGVTSPTPACGKTVTAINLALSIARQPHRSALLVDLDLRKPNVASYLGFKVDEGVVSVLDNRATLAEAVVQVSVGDYRMMVLPTKSPTSGSSDRMASHAMKEMLQDLRKDFSTEIVIVDLPPILSGDDVLAISSQLDCMLLVAATGISTIAQITESAKHLHSTEIVRVVVNKAPASNASNYHHY